MLDLFLEFNINSSAYNPQAANDVHIYMQVSSMATYETAIIIIIEMTLKTHETIYESLHNKIEGLSS